MMETQGGGGESHLRSGARSKRVGLLKLIDKRALLGKCLFSGAEITSFRLAAFWPVIWVRYRVYAPNGRRWAYILI